MSLDLVKRVAHSMPWAPWLPIGVLVALIAWMITDLEPNFASRQLYLRAGLLLAAIGFSFAFDDPAAATTDPTPAPLRRRRLLRLVLSLVPWSAVIAAVMWAGTHGGAVAIWTTSADDLEPGLPIGRLLLEGATMVTWGLAVASLIAKRWDDEPGKVASAALLAIYAGGWMVPERWKPWAHPIDPRWATALPWWWAALLLGFMVTLILSWESRRGRHRADSSRANKQDSDQSRPLAATGR